MKEVLTSTEIRLEYTQEELIALHEDGKLDPKELSDWEVELALSLGLLEWTRENCNRLLR